MLYAGLDLGRKRLDGVSRHPRQLGIRKRLRADEERHHEVVEIEPRLAHEVAQAARPSQPPQTGDRKRAHVDLTLAAGGGGRASSMSTSTGIWRCSSCHDWNAKRSPKNSQSARNAASSGRATKIPGSP